MRKLIFFFLFLITYNSSFSQTEYTSDSKRAIGYYTEGLKNFRLYYFNLAEKDFLKAIKVDASFVEPYILLAKTYLKLEMYEPALNFYNDGLKINPEYYTLGFLEKGELEIYLGKYEEALKSFQSLLKLEKNNKKLIARGNRGIKQAQFCIESVKNPVEFNPIRLDETVNTKDDEYWPSLSADEKILIFTRLVGSDERKFMQEDFFISTRQDTMWLEARNVGKPLNTNDNEGAQSISADGKFMVYTVCNRKGVYGRCDLYFSKRKGNAWTEPENLGPVVNSKSKETQPGITADGREIYFSSDRPGGKGGMDIWVTRFQNDGNWSNPENLGDSINTPGNEISPFIHQDNSTLYFSSDYHTGMGGYDLFLSRKDMDNVWQNAKNIGYPINSSRDEIGLIINSKGDRAYYSTNIDTSWGRDIYYFDLPIEIRPVETSYLKGKVFNAENYKKLEANFELFELVDEQLVNKSTSDPYTGEFLIPLPTNRDYMLNVSKKGYLFYSENFSLKGTFHIEEPFLMDIPLQPLRSGHSIVLKNIFFETDAYQLKNESKPELNKLISFLNNNPDLRVEISGHTDNIGSSGYNLELSSKRAQSVVEYLINKGINENRLIAKGYGLEKPVASNQDEQGRKLNRRTEMKIID
jgi:outer membrane protein OmpA-like peptidoglycan-associated protein